MTKALAKFTSWIVFLPQALRDPAGTSTVRAIAANALPQPQPLLPPPVIAAAGVLLVLMALAFAVRESRLADPHGVLDLRLMVPKLALASAFLAILLGWGLA